MLWSGSAYPHVNTATTLHRLLYGCIPKFPSHGQATSGRLHARWRARLQAQRPRLKLDPLGGQSQPNGAHVQLQLQLRLLTPCCLRSVYTGADHSFTDHVLSISAITLRLVVDSQGFNFQPQPADGPVTHIYEDIDPGFAKATCMIRPKLAHTGPSDLLACTGGKGLFRHRADFNASALSFLTHGTPKPRAAACTFPYLDHRTLRRRGFLETALLIYPPRSW